MILKITCIYNQVFRFTIAKWNHPTLNCHEIASIVLCSHVSWDRSHTGHSGGGLCPTVSGVSTGNDLIDSDSTALESSGGCLTDTSDAWTWRMKSELNTVWQAEHLFVASPHDLGFTKHGKWGPRGNVLRSSIPTVSIAKHAKATWSF